MSLPSLLADPVTLALALLAVTLTGLSKGGLGGAFGMLALPLLALKMPPVQAAALLLPLLIVMDVVSVSTWRRFFDAQVLKAMLPGALLGTALGWALAAQTSDAMIRLMVGLVALGFVARALLPKSTQAAGHSPLKGGIWGLVAGFTSFISHAGAPPFQIYAQPLRLDPKTFAGTAAVFFAVVNAVKVGPYLALGLFERDLLLAAVALFPLAVLATLAGAAIVRRMSPQVFYPFMTVMLALIGLKLTWDGITGLAG